MVNVKFWFLWRWGLGRVQRAHSHRCYSKLVDFLRRTTFDASRDLADHDGDGRLTADEFVVAMHCCDIARAGQSLPSRLPDDWSHTNIMQRERTASLNKPPAMLSPAFALLNHELQETFKSATNEETNETERKNSIVTYEEKRQKNYEVRHLQIKKKSKREIRLRSF